MLTIHTATHNYLYVRILILTAVSYNKLWHTLLDRHLTKTELRKMAGISTNAIAKMGKGETVSLATLAKICTALECDVSDIFEIPNGVRKSV